MACCKDEFEPYQKRRRSKMSLGSVLGNTTCSKGHTHPPWNTTGVLRIAKCESVCGFCQKETKTAANLRKHVAIHIKNEKLGLSIAEGSSGRGRLEMPMPRAESSVSSSSRSFGDEDAMDVESTPPQILAFLARGHPLTPSYIYSEHASSDFSPSTALLSMKESQSHPHFPPRAATSSPTTSYTLGSHTSPGISRPVSTSRVHSSSSHSYTSFSQQEIAELQGFSPAVHEWTGKSIPKDPYKYLRSHNIGTRAAWIVIPASEGFCILDLCKSLSIAALAAEGKLPCYNRETLFDEEWQAHMKDVHGVFLIWPETWVKRIEILDLDAFGGDIVAVNEVIMDS